MAHDRINTRLGRAIKRPVLSFARSHVLLSIFVVGLIIRLLAVVVVDRVSFATGHDGFIAGDDRAYDEVAWQQALAWRGSAPPVPTGNRYLLNVYTYTEAALYVVAGHQPLLMKIVNALLGALTAVLIYLLTRRLFGEFAARLGAFGAVVFPSTILWSATNLKDTMFLCIVALLLWLVIEAAATSRLAYVPAMLILFALVGSLRNYAQIILCIAIPLGFFAYSAKQCPAKWRLGSVFLLGGLVLIGLNSPLHTITVDRLTQQRFLSAQNAQSAFVSTPTPVQVSASSGGVTASTPASAAQAQGPATVQAPESDLGSRKPLRSLINWLPSGIAHVLGGPFPWAAQRTIDRVVMPEVLVWYAAMVLALVGVSVQWRQWRSFSLLMLYLGGVLLVLAMTEGNLGTAIRHRAMLIPFTLVFSGAGAAWLWQRWWPATSAAQSSTPGYHAPILPARSIASEQD